MQVALVEDNDAARAEAASLFRQYGTDRCLTVAIEEYPNAEEFLAVYRNGWFDLVVLDCFLGDGANGVDIARTIRSRGETCPIVFMTASLDFVLDGYDVDASGYLVKPVAYDKLQATLDRIGSKTPQPQLARLEVGGKRTLIDVDLLMYCRSDGHYMILSGTACQTKRLRINFKDLWAALDGFSQIYSPARGYLVNFDHVDRIDGFDFLLSNGDRVPISRQSLPAARTAYSDYMFGKLRKG